jgi:hypothetical protein
MNQRERQRARQIAHGLQEPFDLHRKGDLVRPLRQLLENLPGAALFLNDKQLLLGVVSRVQRRIDEAGIDERQVDAGAMEFQSQALGEIDHRRLAGPVAAIAGPARITEQRAHDRKMAGLPREHPRQHRRHAVDDAIHVERHGLVEAVEIDVADVERRIHARTEQREIDRPELRLHLRGARFERVRLQDVGRKRRDVLARCRKRIEPFARTRRRGDLHAGGREPPRDLAADRTRGTSDPRHLPGKGLLGHDGT